MSGYNLFTFSLQVGSFLVYKLGGSVKVYFEEDAPAFEKGRYESEVDIFD
jgi:hypothetical protein